MSTAPNSLMGSWPGNGGLLTPPSPNPLGGVTQPGFDIPLGGSKKTLEKNTVRANLQGQLERNQLVPLFAQIMGKYGTGAGDFFKQLMDLGSPFYQQKQRQSFEQGVKSGNDATAQARQGVAASGAGFTPSGVGAAMMGGMGVGQSQNQAETFLNNLFQNEQLQMNGAQGLSQLASLFNPAAMFGNAPLYNPPTWASQFKDVMSGVGSLFGGGGVSTKGRF